MSKVRSNLRVLQYMVHPEGAPWFGLKSSADETVVTAAGSNDYFGELWRYRELFAFLAWRDILVRYKQTVVGVAWSVLRPVLTTAVLVFVFSRVGNVSSGEAPYPLMVFCGMLPWMFFSTAVMTGGESLVNNASLVSKVYFPKLIVPLASLSVSLVDFLISLGILAVIMIWYQWIPSVEVIMLPLLILLAAAVSFGVSIWIAALMVQYRDFRFIIPFLVQLGLYISPVGYPSQIVPEQYKLLYALNPMVGVIDGFRAVILGGTYALQGPNLLISVIAAAALVASGIFYFRRTERQFADII
jgi:lipopolysaccharide transport system permease protein